MHQPEIISLSVANQTEGESGFHTISCACWGDDTKPVVLCVHGLTRDGRDFDFLARQLCDDFYVICPDMAGRGSSEWFKDATHYQNLMYLADIFSLLRGLDVSNVHWIGTSMGGILGMMAANTAPGIIQSMVLNDIGCLVPGTGLARIGQAVNAPVVFESKKKAQSAYRIRCASFGISDDAHWQHVFDHGIKRYGENDWRYTYDPKILEIAFGDGMPQEDVDLWGLWPAIQHIPALLIRGADSDILLDKTARAMQDEHPNLQYETFSGMGHAPSLMADDQIACVKKWLHTKAQV